MSNKAWHIAIGSEQQGPFSLEELLPRFRSGELAPDTYVFTQGMANWVAASTRPEFDSALSTGQGAPPVPPAGGVSDVIDYKIFGEEMQFVEITLDPREACIAEAGAFMYMDPGIEMQTIFGDGSGQTGGTLFDKFLSAGKRVLTGESLFMTLFANSGHQRQNVAFASPYPGSIVPVDLDAHGNMLMCQKESFLCAAKGVAVGIAFQRKLGAGLFGGEGFILQKLEGDGLAFLHAGGTVVERSLAAGETMRLDTGCLVAFEQQVSYDIQAVPGIKSKIFGGEGLFYAALTGPGKIWIQSLPFSRLAKQVYAAAPQTGGTRKGEGSILGGLGDLLDGT
ncbi:MAG: TIGR00266 family protein [Acidobacteriota bacterium]